MYGKSMSCVVLVWLVVARIRGLSQVLPRLPVSRLGWAGLAGLGWAGLHNTEHGARNWKL